MLDRRDLLKLAGGALLVPSCGGPGFTDVCGADGDFDTVLQALHFKDLEWDGGLSNHGPMAAQVLYEQGRVERMCEWVGGYIGNLDPLTPGAFAIPPADQSAALGNVGMRAAWVKTYILALDTMQDALVYVANEIRRLLPGYAAAAFHGPLRTGHAMRAYVEFTTTSRGHEVAHGLAHWASRYRELPGVPGSQPVTGIDVVTALKDLDPLPTSKQQSGGFIHERMEKISELPTFAAQVARVDLSAIPLDDALTELAAAAARLYIADGNRDNLGYLHAVDGTVIFRSLAPFLDDAGKLAGLGYVFQAVAALHATHASGKGVPQMTYPGARTLSALLDEAATSDDEHTIKFVAALANEHTIDPRPEFLAAAELRL